VGRRVVCLSDGSDVEGVRREGSAPICAGGSEVMREEIVRSISPHYGIEWRGEYSNVYVRQNGIPSSTILSSSAPASSFVEERFWPDFLPGLDEAGFALSPASASSSSRLSSSCPYRKFHLGDEGPIL